MRTTRLCVLCLHWTIARYQPEAQRVCRRCTKACKERERKAALTPAEARLEQVNMVLREALACMRIRAIVDRQYCVPVDEGMDRAIVRAEEVLK